MGKRRNDLRQMIFWRQIHKGLVIVGTGSGGTEQGELGEFWLEQLFEWWYYLLKVGMMQRKEQGYGRPKCHLGQTECDVLSGHPSGYEYWNLHVPDVADELGSVSMKSEFLNIYTHHIQPRTHHPQKNHCENECQGQVVHSELLQWCEQFEKTSLLAGDF